MTATMVLTLASHTALPSSDSVALGESLHLSKLQLVICNTDDESAQLTGLS